MESAIQPNISPQQFKFLRFNIVVFVFADSFAGCLCEKCKASYRYIKGDRNYATELVWGVTSNLAARLTAEGELDAGPGGLLRLKNAVISSIPEDENGFPAARYYAGRGIFYGIDCESFASEGSSPALTDRIAAFSERLSARLSSRRLWTPWAET